ncbi:hypothetical protein [Streptomyces hoynatensis]|nr:hypothetical protein [Streptomyces hoynatensis]
MATPLTEFADSELSEVVPGPLFAAEGSSCAVEFVIHAATVTDATVYF